MMTSQVCHRRRRCSYRMSNLADITLTQPTGASNLRIWGIDHRGQVIDTINGKGMSSLIPSEFEPYLISLIKVGYLKKEMPNAL